MELGDDKTPLNQPSFRNTLSSGDRSTLALAFFLAQLKHDSGNASRIVVFDDPFNSQDSFRKDHTVRKIRDCGETCTQVIVFSHDLHFLKRIWDRLQEKVAERKCLELQAHWPLQHRHRRVGYRSRRRKAPTRRTCQALTDFYHDGIGKPLNVVQKIRPILETYTKFLADGTVTETDTLGVIVRQDPNRRIEAPALSAV